MPNEVLDRPLDSKEQITDEELEDIGEVALDSIPIEVDHVGLLHEEFPSVSPRPGERVGQIHHMNIDLRPEDSVAHELSEVQAKEAVDTIHAFGQNESDLLHKQRSIERLDAQKTKQELVRPTETGATGLGYTETGLEQRFGVIAQTARLKAEIDPHDLPDNWGKTLEKISTEQIGYNAALLARVYKRTLVDGSLSAYKDLAKALDRGSLTAIEDEEKKQMATDQILAIYAREYEVKDRKRQEARRNNEFVGTKYANEILQAPNLLEREAISLSDEDIEELLSASETERQKLIAELTDPFRRRLDQDAGPKAKEELKKEGLQIGVLLESLPESWQRDLLAVEAWRFYMHKNVGDPEKAMRSINLISNPEIRAGVEALHIYLSDRTPEQVVEALTVGSRDALDILTKAYGSSPEELKLKAEAKKPGMRITINIRSQPSPGLSKAGITTVEKILLDSHRILSAHEVGRESSMSEADAGSRSRGESRAGFDPYDVVFDRPVYGTLVESDEDLILGDPGARWYGSCVIVLRPEVMDRSTFSYGDSARAFDAAKGLHTGLNVGAGTMRFEEAAAAKALFDERNPNRSGNDAKIGEEFIEAQILGGVSAEDIEAVTIPLREVLDHRLSIRALAIEYPSIKFRCLLRPEESSQKSGIEKKLKDLKNIEVVVIGQEQSEQQFAEAA